MTTILMRIQGRRPLTVRNTSVHGTPEVKEIIRDTLKVMGIPGRAICINVRNGASSLAGRAYPYIPSISNAPPSARYLITLRLPTLDYFPSWHQGYSQPISIGGNGIDKPPPLRQLMDPPGFKRWPLIVLPTWRHGLVYITAHEAMHIEQFRHGLKTSEIQCEWAGARALKGVFG